jgi:glycosyl transferase, family 25
MVSELHKAGIDHEFVEGVEGRDLDLSDGSLVDPAWLGEDPYWSGVVGCYLSHLKVLKKVLEADTERALVLEDDVILPADMGTLVEAVSTHMAGAEAVLLQHIRFGPKRGEAYRVRRRGSVQLPGSRVLAIPADVGDVGGAGAYLITRDACRRMAKAMLPVRAPVDDWSFFCNKGILDKVRCVVPMPVRVNLRFRTTIEHYGPGTLQTRLRNAVTRVPLLSHALTFRRQRIMARNTQVELVDDF